MKMNLTIQFGMRIKYLRISKKMSQEDLALECGISKNYLSDVERGRRNISLIAINKIANGLKVNLSTLFLGVDDSKF